MTSEKEINKCRDCKYNRPAGTCGDDFYVSGSGTSGQVEGELSLPYNFLDRPVCECGVVEKKMEERLVNLEKRLALLEQTEPVETPKEDTPKLLLEIVKFIGKIYSSEEVDKAIQLLQNEIANEGEHNHNMPGEWEQEDFIEWEPERIEWEPQRIDGETSDGSLQP